jgi:purine-binding chemotaxis protein CheW
MTAAIAANGEISTPDLGSRRDDDNARTAAATTEFISFAVGDEKYGVNIMAVREIKDWSAISQLPNQPAYMGFLSGLVAIEKTMIALIDLKSLLASQIPVHSPTQANP